MNSHPLPSQLSQFESQLAFLCQSLVQPYPDDLLAAASELQATAVALAADIPAVASSIRNSAADQQRVKIMAAKLISLCEALSRQNVGIERALATLIPTAKTHTYPARSGLSSRQPYGSAGRQSGEFKPVSA
jgi:hypothetical protein